MANVYVLSSSPPARDLSIFDMPSSSPLPSVGEILKKKPQSLRTGSRAAPIPQHATATFTSAATLLHSALSNDIDIDTIEDPPKSAKPRRRKVVAKTVEKGETKVANPKVAVKKVLPDGEKEEKKPRKPRTKPNDAAEDREITKKEVVARKPRPKKADKKMDDENAKEKPARKTKAKKDTESQTKLPKGKVTKVSTASLADAAPKAILDPFQDSLDIGLVEAVRRRTTWTPPPQLANEAVTTPSDVGLLDGSLSAGSLFSGEKSKGFADLLGNYGFTMPESKIVKPTLAVEGARKRKLIELVKTSVATAAAKSPVKAPKKKPRTLTDLATSAYAEEEEAPPADLAPLLQYFSLHTAGQTTSDGFKIPSKPRSRSPVKGGKKAKKGTAQAPILLSPESAMKQVGRQDFVFGTSSQLAREDSPTLLRDLHEAMQASNEADDDTFAEQLTESISQTLSGRGMSTTSAKRNLWSAASRDIAGDLQSVEMVDLIDTPVNTRTLEPQSMLDPPVSMLDETDDGLWQDVEKLSQSLTQKPQPPNALSQSAPPEVEGEKTSPRPAKRPALDHSPLDSSLPPSTQPPKSSQIAPKAAKKSRKTKDLVKPDFSSYTTAQLAKEIASYRFKPIKSRDQMILLLEKCWEGKNRAALAALGTNTALLPRAETSKTAVLTQSQTEATPKRPRGRPRKDSAIPSPAKPEAKTARKKSLDTVEYLEMDSDTPLSQLRTLTKSQKKSKEPAEDIFDPDPALTPSPPRRVGTSKKTKPLTLKISSSLSDASLELSATSSQRLLFKHISSAVINASPAKDASNPSWHEKILMYDPIILEDLTVWLNTGALEKAGWDGEVDPKEVKKWCESKSICCLWKENLRGGTRSRY
ncbi:hypothetical protein IFR04_015539 [Cadophora malorum]|uniref:Structure-specific endonuclease subunit SLX4 n=1 Tax=Cadophora malorum TaxID=108018 RepID=A0A8H7SYS4_9HELO|nr:hypothetical protein IFR04_015539 [Cadophora malorum]